MACVTAVLLIVIAVMTASRFVQAQDAGDEIVTKLEPAATNASRLLLSTADMERGVRTYVSAGKAGALGAYAEGSNVSEDAVTKLAGLLAGTNPLLVNQVAEVTASRAEWIETVATPTIALMRASRPAQAGALLDSNASLRSFELLRARATALNTQIDVRLLEQFTDLGYFASQLGAVLLGSGFLIAAGVVLIWWLLRRSVLHPLKSLGEQMGRVAGDGGYGGDRREKIIPQGPPEIAQVGQAAEDMRARLVKEIDTVDRQRESLDSEGVVVTALRAELWRDPRVYAIGLDIYGEMEPSESEIAGDWWEAVALPDGRTALIITDISGHGPQAGIAGLRLKLALVGMLEAGSSLTTTFDRGVRLFADTPERFATAAIVTIDPSTNQVEWANAGHLPPLVLAQDGGYRELTVTGPLLSTLGGAWTSETTDVNPDDLIVMWTDGVTESRDAAGEELEVAGLCSIIAGARLAGLRRPNELVEKVLFDGRIRAVNWGNDDRTLIIASFDQTPRVASK